MTDYVPTVTTADSYTKGTARAEFVERVVVTDQKI
jgi:hypothetical protein